MPSGHVDKTKLRPLSGHAINVLRAIADKPAVCHSLNPGVSQRLMRGGLVMIVPLPSPYQMSKGTDIPHYQITDAGLAAIKA